MERGNIMPSRGGPSDKYGNRYEGYWTVDCIAEVLEGKADFIYLEPPGIEGVEFCLRKNDLIIYYQVKRQNVLGKWTLSNLEREKILSNFYNKLIDENSVCYFISSYASHELSEFTDSSRKQNTFEKFKARISESNDLEKSFKDLCGYWNCSEKEAYECLKRFYVKTIDEDSLIERVEYKLYPLVEGNSATVSDILTQYALKRTTEKLSGDDIWSHLKNRGHPPKEITEDSKILKTAQDIDKKYIQYLTSKQIHEDFIPRKEVNKVLRTLISTKISNAAILGNAGSGKSNIILQTMLELDNEDIPYLIIRADRLSPTISPEELGLQLGLEDNPVKVLGAIAKGRSGILIIDQLDSMSLISGRHPEFFECIHEMVRQCSLYPNLSVLIASRNYDLDNDSRFKALIKDYKFEPISVSPLTKKEVISELEKIGFTDEISKKQLDLFSLPINLKLLKEVVNDPRFDMSNLNDSHYLYEMFWESKENSINQNSKFRVRWTDVIDKLCEYMDSKQVFSVPKIILDDFTYDSNLMVSENVLTLEENHFSFFHEEFFDYSFARRFSAKDIELSSYLKKTEQDLVRRTQVRQILRYERDANFIHFINDVELILKDPNIRFHIKEAVLAFLSQIKDPTDVESNLIIDLTKDPSINIFNNIWRSLYGSIYWYNKIDALNQIEYWLASEDDIYINKAMWLNYGIKDEIPDKVAELIEPYVNKSESWNNRIIQLIEFAPLEKGYKLYKLFLSLIDEGILDDVDDNGDFGDQLWEHFQHSILRNLSEKSPQRACEIIKHYLMRRVLLSILNDSHNPFVACIPQFQFDEGTFLDLAENAPYAFIKCLLPLMIGLMENNKINNSVRPVVDEIWNHRFFGRPVSSEDILLKSMGQALKLLAKRDPIIFKDFENLLITSNLETARFLLLSSYSANGKAFVDKAVRYVLRNPESLETGYRDSKFWVTKKLIESIRPFCSNGQLRQIEKVILDYYPINLQIYKWASTFYPNLLADFHHMSKCRVQFGLLEATPPYNRSDIIRDRLGELKKELNIESSIPPNTLEPMIVVSPIDALTAENMRDEEWLESIQRYNDENEIHLEGGPVELSRQLESIVKKDPERFSKLVYEFPENTNPYYFGAVLNGISDSNLDVDDIISVCVYCHELPGSPCGRWICDTISKQAHENLSDEALEIVAWYAINDPDPEEELWNSNNSTGVEYFGGDIFNAGINSIRGNAALTIQNLIIHDKSRILYFEKTLKKMVLDHSTAVRSCVIETLRGVLGEDKDLGLNLSKFLFNDEKLFKAKTIEYFLYQALNNASNDQLEYILTIINRMISSNLEDVTMVGAKVATYASILLGYELPQMRYCLYISEIHRKGVAEVLSSNILNLNSLFMDRLIDLFNDISQEVQEEVSTVFRQLKDNLNDYEDLISKYITSKAFDNNHDRLFWALETTTPLPQITLEACERFFEVTKHESGDIRTSAAGVVRYVGQLILRLYSETKNYETKNRCLNLIDYMLEISVYNFDRELLIYERKPERR
jgi:hypothetical protein